MTAAASGPVRSPLAAGWGTAVRRGLLAFGIVAAVAEGAALAVYALGPSGIGLGDAVRVGGLYVAMFHRVPLRLSADEAGLFGFLGSSPATGSAAALHAEIAIVPLAVTALAAWLLWRAGRAVAVSAGGSSLERAMHGAKVAPVYAGAVAATSLLSSLHVSGFELVPPREFDLSAAPVLAVVLPLVLAAVAAAGGGWWSAGAGEMPPPRAVLAGGWTMLVAGLLLSYAGLFLAGVVRPDGLEALLTPSTGRYYQTLFGRADVGMVLLGHHLALAPNEAAWVLTPAMGGCTGAFPETGEPSRFLCYGRFPLEVPVPSWLPASGVPGETAGSARFGTAPAPYFLFLLVPAAAAVLGGRRAASSGAVGSGREAVVLGAAAGTVFAVLVTAVSWAASISAAASLTVDATTDRGGVRLGPDLLVGGLLALAWGVAGGALGAELTRRRRGTGSPPRPRSRPPR